MSNIEEILEYTTEDPNLFVKYILALPYELSPIQKYILSTFYDPMKKYSELLLACGRKAGKTTLAAIITLFEVYKLLQRTDVHEYYNLIPNQNIYVLNICPAEEQALGITFQYIKALAESSWYLSEYLLNVTSEELLFENDIVVRCQPSSSRSARGYACFVNLYDELAHFLTKTGNQAGNEVYSALQPNLRPFKGDAKTICISSPAGRQGIFWELFKYGDPVHTIQHTTEHGTQPWRAVFQHPTWDLNPDLPFDHVDLQRELKRDPDKFYMEYGAQFCDVIDSALDSRLVQKCAIGQQVGELIEDRETPRVITLDPATVGNSYALVMGHMKLDMVHVDLIKVWEGSRENPIDIDMVENEVRSLCGRFKITDIGIDQYQSAGTVQRLKKEGKPIMETHITSQYNTEMYGNLIERVNTGKIVYPPHARLLNELTFLQKKYTGRTFKVEAALGHSDDITDALANLCFILTQKQSQRFVWGRF